MEVAVFQQCLQKQNKHNTPPSSTHLLWLSLVDRGDGNDGERRLLRGGIHPLLRYLHVCRQPRLGEGSKLDQREERRVSSHACHGEDVEGHLRRVVEENGAGVCLSV